MPRRIAAWVYGVVLLLVQVSAQIANAAPPDPPNIAVFAGPNTQSALLRIDQDDAGLDGPGIRFQVRRGTTGQATTLWRTYKHTKGLFQLKDIAPGTSVSVRAQRLEGSTWATGPWSPASQVPQAQATADRLTKIAPEDWEIRSDPEVPYALQVRLSRLPNAGTDIGTDMLLGLRLRRYAYDMGVILPAEAGVWHRVVLPPDTGPLTPARPAPISIAAVTSSQLGPWSRAKQAQVVWRGAVLPPNPLHPGDWMIRPDGRAGIVTIETVALPDLRGSTNPVIEARWAATDGHTLDPQNGWSDWTPLGPPDAQGRAVVSLTGLKTGANSEIDGAIPFLVQVRLHGDAGPGTASAPKQVVPQAFPLTQTQAVLGDMNPAGTGRIRVPKGARIDSISPNQSRLWSPWTVEDGPEGWDYLVPGRAPSSDPVTVTFTDGHKMTITRQPRSFVAETAADLAIFLGLSAAEKSGATLLVGPEWIDVIPIEAAFTGAFDNLSAPLTVRPREPELSTLVSRFLLRSARPDRQSGNIRLQDMRFYLPEAAILRTGRGGTISIIEANRSRGPVVDIQIDRTQILSDAMPGRTGYDVDKAVRAIDMTGAKHTTVTNSEISHVTYGFSIGSQHALVRGNTVHHVTADPFNIHYRPGTTAAPRRLHDITIEHNTAHDFMGDAWKLHGDALHMWMIGAGRAPDKVRIDRLVYRGNVTFPGHEGMLAPPRLSPSFTPLYLNGNVDVTPIHHRRILRIPAGSQGTIVQLPAPEVAINPERGAPDGMLVAIQKSDQGPGPLRIRFNDQTEDLILRRPWEAVILRALPEGKDGSAPHWTTQVPGPAYQGFYSDGNDVPLSGLIIEGNIFWGMAPWQIAPRNRPQNGTRVHHNSILLPYPGDATGDGHYNTASDGATMSNGRIELGAWDDSVAIWANTAGIISVAKNSAPGKMPAIWGNRILKWSDMAEMHRLFAAAEPEVPGDATSLSWFPTTRAEAIAMGRPRVGGPLDGAGIGALGATPDTDWWNFDTGARAENALNGVELLTLSPTPEDHRVPPLRPALTLTLSQPAGLGEGTACLVRITDDETARCDPTQTIARWDLSDPLAVHRFGPELSLPLAAPLPTNHPLELQLPDGGVRDIFGQAMPPLSTPWRFTVDGDAAVNVLPTGDPRDPWWSSSGWIARDSHNSEKIYSRKIGSSGNALRLDSTRYRALRTPGQRSLRFDYTRMPTNVTLRTALRVFVKDGDTSNIEVIWDRIPLETRIEVAPGVYAQRRTAGTAYGAAPQALWTAELTWTTPETATRVLIDLLKGFPANGGAGIGRLMLSDGPGGQAWSSALGGMTNQTP